MSTSSIDAAGTTRESTGDPRWDFEARVREHGGSMEPLAVETLQVNVTKLCNQACGHCHVDSSPQRTEQIDRRTVDRCLEILAEHDGIATLDLTGGAPELNPHFDDFVREARALGKHVMVRHNFTVTIDGCPVTGESKAYLPEFFAEHGVEVVASLPYYKEYFTDKQRGRGVFDKSIRSFRMLNEVGYGEEGSDLELNLVYNPVGAFLPASQESLQADYEEELAERFGLVFDHLFVITNMPIHRFRDQLERLGRYEDYMTKLANAYNPAAVEGVMCRSLISVDHEGRIYDCDFNQQIDLPVEEEAPRTVFDFDMEALLARRIATGPHCFGCTAGAGSSCGGETA